MRTDSTIVNVDFAHIMRIVRRRAPLVLLCAVLTAAITFVVSQHKQKIYTAKASLLFRNAQLDQQAAGLSVPTTINPKSTTDTNIQLASLPTIAASTATAVGHGMTPGRVRAAVTVAPESDTQLAGISATSTSPELAANIANSYGQAVIGYHNRSDRGYYANALRALNLQFKSLTLQQQHGGQGANLRDRATSLQILSKLDASDIQLVQKATPPGGASSPRVRRDTALGFIAGLVLGLLLAFAAERFDRRVREPSDLENLYRAPLLAVVPQSSALKLSSDMPEAANRVLPADVAEVFGLLRAHIRYYNVDQQPRVVLVVSASPGDGKTTVARNLALVSGTVGARTLFVEADLRRPTAAKQFGVSPAPGLVDVLTNELPFKDVVQTVQVTQRGQRQDVVDVLTAGGVVPASPAQMLESHAMEHLLEQAKRTYDLVVVDTPPLVMLSDAFPLLRQADGVLIVSRLGQNRSDVAVRLREMLASSEAPVIGVVANGYKSAGGTSYGYGYTDAEYLNAPIVELAAAETSRNGAPDHPVSVPGANSEPPARGEPAGHAQDPNGPAPAGTARNGVGSTEAVGSVSGVSSVSGTSASAESAGNGWRPDEGNGRNGISGADPSQLLPDLQQPTAPQEPEGNRRRSGGIRGKLQQALRDRRS